MALSSGISTDTPTWQYVKDVIAANITKADTAVGVAYGQLEVISKRYQDIMNSLPAEWFVDTDIGTNTTITWTSPVTGTKGVSEPSYTDDVPTDAAVPDVNIPSAIVVQAQPKWEFEQDDPPAIGEMIKYGSLPTLGTIDNINVSVPDFEIEYLDTEFEYEEDSYEEQLAGSVKSNIARVLGGNLGIPQEYWDAMWAKASGDLAAQQVGLARNARNRGAATHWGLPTEAVLTASRAVQDEGTQKLSLVRIEQAQEQARLAHADFWKAIDAAIRFEQQWIDLHNKMSDRALAAAQQLSAVAIQVHNANVVQYNALVEKAKTTLAVQNSQIEATLKEYAAKLQKSEIEIKRNQSTISLLSAETQVYSVSQTVQIQAIAEKVKWWNSQWESHSRYEKLKQEKAQLDISNYAALLSKIQAISQATAQVLNARVGAEELTLKSQTAKLSQEQMVNAAALDVSKLTQAAEQANAQLQVAQSQWLNGQGSALLQHISQLSYSLAQALVTVSDVNLGSTYGASDGYSESASHNSEKVW